MNRATNKMSAAGIVLVMVFLGLMLWIGIPLIWLWIGSQVVESSQPSMGPYMLVFVGVIVSIIVVGKCLAVLGRKHAAISGNDGMVRVQLPWHRSMRGEREVARERSVLDVVMVGTVILAGACMGIWFLLFAGSSLPGA